MAVCPPCPVCHEGVMIKPYPVHSYDFSKEGYILQYCNSSNCSVCNDIEEIIPDSHTIVYLSNRFIKKIVDITCNHGMNYDYIQKKVLYSQLKDRRFPNPVDFYEAFIIALKELGIQIDLYHVEKTIYSLVDLNSFC